MRPLLIISLIFLFHSQRVKCETIVTQISQYGITWTFDKPVVAGQFITGDWWVIGPVNIVRVTPTPGSIGSDTTHFSVNHWNDSSLSRDTIMRNGSMIVDKPSKSQGYDSRNKLYKPTESIIFPFILKPNQSLISTESNVNLPVDNFCKSCVTSFDKTVKTVLKSAAVLTCLSSVPPKDAFRPPYAGKLKPIFLARNIDYPKLPKLSIPDSVPDWATYEHYFERPWLDHLMSWQHQEIVPNENQPNYGREQARLVSIASLMLMLDVPKEKKEKLTIELIQRGIDLYGLAMAGGYWNEGGGLSSGRKWPILFASIMLNKPSIAKLPATALFLEDTETYYGKGWFGQTALWQIIAHHEYKGTYEEMSPETWGKWEKVSEGYRTCCTSSAWVGAALAARYLKAVKLWGHDAYFDYVDRWMREDDPYSEKRGAFKRPEKEGKASDVFVTQMWKANRANAPQQPISGKNMKWVWKGKIGGMVSISAKTKTEGLIRRMVIKKKM
jgi:hypothetical protein